MPDYRLYLLHPEHGHITSADDLHAPDDLAAEQAIRQQGYDVPVELWSGARKVGHIKPPLGEALG